MKGIADKITFECCSFRLRTQNYRWSSMDPGIWVHLKAFVCLSCNYTAVFEHSEEDNLRYNRNHSTVSIHWQLTKVHALRLFPEPFINSSLWITPLCSWTRPFKYCSCAIGSSKQAICLVSDICNVILLVLVINWATAWISINKSVSGSPSPSLLLHDDMFT